MVQFVLENVKKTIVTPTTNNKTTAIKIKKNIGAKPFLMFLLFLIIELNATSFNFIVGTDDGRYKTKI